MRKCHNARKGYAHAAFWHWLARARDALIPHRLASTDIRRTGRRLYYHTAAATIFHYTRGKSSWWAKQASHVGLYASLKRQLHKYHAHALFLALTEA